MSLSVLPASPTTSATPSSGIRESVAALSARLLQVLAAAQEAGTRMDLDAVAMALGADVSVEEDGVRERGLRREDVRALVARLDGEGFVDASRMRLTLAGFAIAKSLPEKPTGLRLVR